MLPYRVGMPAQSSQVNLSGRNEEWKGLAQHIAIAHHINKCAQGGKNGHVRVVVGELTRGDDRVVWLRWVSIC
jgi:hypothetical protein